MSNPYVDRLIEQLNGVLQEKRERRNVVDGFMLGQQQAKEKKALEVKNKAELAHPAQSGYQKPGSVDLAYRYEGTSPQSAHFRPPAQKQSGYPTPDVQVEPAYRYQGTSPEAAGGSPGSRMALAQKLIQQQGLAQEDANAANDPEDPNGQDPLGLGSISANYQNGDGLGTLSKNYRTGGASKAAEAFIRARSTPNEPLEPGVAAALRTDPKQAAAIDAAGHPDTGNFGGIAQRSLLGGPQSSYGGDRPYAITDSPSVGALRQSVRGQPSPEDMALLNELAKRYHSPEELSGR